MTFRRSKSSVAEERRWQEFRNAHRELLGESGIPAALEEYRSFQYFLMHGHHPPPIDFCVDELDDEQVSALKTLIVEYLAVFEDPGLAIFGRDSEESLRRAAAEIRDARDGAS